MPGVDHCRGVLVLVVNNLGEIECGMDLDTVLKLTNQEGGVLARYLYGMCHDARSPCHFLVLCRSWCLHEQLGRGAHYMVFV